MELNIEPYVTKVIFVDERFLEDIGQFSRKSLDEFSNPGLDTKVISLPLKSPSEVEKLSRMIDVSAICPGSIVVKPAYSDQFVSIETFSEDLVNGKYDCFVQLCIALGAKKVVISNVEAVNLSKDENAKTLAGLDAGGVLGGGGVELKNERSSQANDIAKSVREIKTEAQGGEPDIALAEEIIRKYGLNKDPLFTGMLNMCRTVNNRLRKHEFSLDFSKDVKRVFDASIEAKIKLMSEFYKGSGTFERARHSIETTRTATKLSIMVDF